MKRVDKIVWGNVKKEGEKTTITFDVSMLDVAKDKKKENNFSTAEMIFTLSAGTGNELDSITKSPSEKLSFRLQMLINALSEGMKENKGFYWEHYVPFFVDMKEKKMVGTLAHLMLLRSGDEENLKWIEDNEPALESFYDWLKSYKWPAH